jgi:hypothetical protein
LGAELKVTRREIEMIAEFAFPSLPGLTRQSSEIDWDSDLDARVTPGNEGAGFCLPNAFYSEPE